MIKNGENLVTVRPRQPPCDGLCSTLLFILRLNMNIILITIIQINITTVTIITITITITTITIIKVQHHCQSEVDKLGSNIPGIADMASLPYCQVFKL